jgi:hypothetical protein
MAGRIAYLGNIVTQGLVLDLDAAIKGSYPGTGSIWTDVSNNNNNGTLINGPTFSSADYGSIVFDGVNDFVATNYTGSTSSDFTFSSWALNPTTSSQFSLVRGNDGTGGWSLSIGFTATQLYATVVTTVPNTFETLVTGSTWIQNQWYNITGIWKNGNSISLYVNGNLITSVSTTRTLLRTSTTGWNIATITPSLFSNIRVSNALIYDRALSSTEVQQNFNALRGRYGI